MKPLEFSPLEDLSQLSPAPMRWVVGFALMIVISVVLLTGTGIVQIWDVVNLVPVTLVAMAVYSLYGRSRAEKLRAQQLAKFAELNEFQFMPQGGMIEPRPGSLFRHGHSQKVRNVVLGDLHKLPFRLFEYEYTTGSGKSSQLHDQMVMECILPHPQHHLVLDSMTELGAKNASVLPIEFDDSQRLQLEGDFNRYFHVYSPIGYHINALALLTPDVMHTILTSANNCDIEVVGDRLYLYWPGLWSSVHDYRAAFGSAEAILTELGPKLSRTTIQSGGQPEAVHSQELAIQGARLKRGGPSALIVLAVLAFLIAYFLPLLLIAWRLQDVIWLHVLTSALMPIMLFGLLITALINRQRRKATRSRLLSRYTKPE